MHADRSRRGGDRSCTGPSAAAQSIAGHEVNGLLGWMAGLTGGCWAAVAWRVTVCSWLAGWLMLGAGLGGPSGWAAAGLELRGASDSISHAAQAL